MFSGNLRIQFGDNQYKKMEYNQHNFVFKEFNNNDLQQNQVTQLSYYLNVTDLLINPLIFISFCYCVFHNVFLLLCRSLQQRVQSWKFKILLGIPNQSLLCQTLNNTNFYLSTLPAKITDKIFKINKKTPILWSFQHKGNFS